MSSFVPQPLALQFLGRVDRKIFDEDITDKGFIVHAAHIATSKNKDTINEGPEVQLVTPRGIKKELRQGDFCAISCKFIGSNTRRADQLHYIAATKTNFGHENQLPFSLSAEAVNKAAIIGLGVIMEKKVVQTEAEGKRSKVLLTLKSMDYDPVTNEKAVWLTRHEVSLELFPLGVENQYNVDDQVQLSGIVTDYNADEYMWTTEVYCITAVGKHYQQTSSTAIEMEPHQSESTNAMIYKKARLPLRYRYKTKKRSSISKRKMCNRQLLWKAYNLKDMRECVFKKQ